MTISISRERMNEHRRNSANARTWKFPWIVVVDIEEPDHVEALSLACHHVLEIETQKFLLGRVEPEPGELELGHLHTFHPVL